MGLFACVCVCVLARERLLRFVNVCACFVNNNKSECSMECVKLDLFMTQVQLIQMVYPADVMEP